MRFSDVASSGVRLFLLLTALGRPSDADSTAAPSMTTQKTHQQTSESVSNHATSEHNTFISGPTITTQGFKQWTEEKTSNITKIEQNITISGHQVEKNITIISPSYLDLLCTLTVNQSMKLETIVVTWKTDNETIRTENVTKNEILNTWSSQYMVHVQSITQTRTYTCFFKTEQETKGTFHVRVPEIKGKSKQIISYEGDFVVLTCESVKYDPIYWIWYTNNGSEQVAINDTVMPKKFNVIREPPANKTKLKILDLSEKDGGVYWCQAVFQVGESKGTVSLKVLSYMVPLKPFLVIAAEVIILVALIFIFEVYSKKKETHVETEKEIEQTEQLKSEDSNGLEISTTRQRKV